MTVAITLAEMTHHTAPRGPKMARVGEGVEHEQHDGLRAQKPPLPGVRPGSLLDPGPQRSDRTVRHSAVDTPLQVLPALRGDDGVDGTTLRFLLEQNLSLKKKQEEKEKEKEKEMKEKKVQQVKLEQLRARRRVVIRELDALLLVPFVRRSDQENDRVDELQKLRDRLNREFDLISAPSKRKKKKKRKKKLPRGRARRRQRQRPLSGALIVDSGSGICKAGFSSSRCVPFGCRQAQMLGIMAGMTRRAGFSLRPLVSGSHLFAVLFYSGYMLCQSTAAFVGGAFRIQRNAWFASGSGR